MIRITEQSMLNTNVGAIRNNYRELDASQTRLGTGQRITRPHEDVAATINSLYLRSRISMVSQYSENMHDGVDRLNVAHDALGSLTDTLHRARELAVQGANGTYTDGDRVAMAMEIEALLGRAHEISLTKFKGEYVFSGNEAKKAPFRVMYQQDAAMGREKIVGLIYEGDGGQTLREVEDGKYVDLGMQGNRAFWASNQTLTSRVNAGDFISDREQSFMIDTSKITIERGDTLEAVVDKINRATSSVEASISVGRAGERTLRLTTLEPHRTLMRDIEGGETLQRLGMVREGVMDEVGDNYHPGLIVGGKSTFEAIMFARDALLNDDPRALGSAGIGFLDEAINNITHNQAKASATVERFDNAIQKFATEKVRLTESLSRMEDVDYASESINFNLWQYAHRASLQTAARLLNTTLMDFLR